jgi:sodium transport system permease protein
MGRRDVRVVFWKELVEVTRDKKTLIFMVLLPVLLIPALLELTMRVVSAAEVDAAGKVLSVSLRGEAEVLDRLRPALEEARIEVVATGADAAKEDAKRVVDGELDLAVEVSREEGRFEARVLYDNASVTSKALERMTPLLEKVSQGMRAERLAALGVAAPEQAALIEPLAIESIGVAPLREVVGERVGSTLSFLLIVFCFLGAMYPAIDLAAGEKERGTLMTLLLVPTPRWRLVLGKLFVIFVTGVVAALLSLLGLGGWLALQGGALDGALGGVLATIGFRDLSLMFLMLLPTALIFASLLLSISVYAKSFKEAQNYIAPLNLLILLPGMFATLPGVELGWGTAWIPITNVVLVIEELIKGTLQLALLGPVLGSGLLVGGALLWFTTRWFSRESVLFRR